MNEVQGLGRIQEVDLRKVWAQEAEEFTPWLAKHISELGDSLGLDLEFQSQEAPVGKFSLDLLAHEAGTKRTVIIENQLEPTNHDHLGKLLTYAGGYDANVIVWVAKEFREEHRQALDWLNQHTDDDTEFFGVMIEVWKIDGSRPAPHFKTIAAPNEWQRKAARSVRAGSVSEKNRRYESFFQGLIDALREKEFTKARKAQPQNWYSFSAGHARRVQYSASFAQGNKAQVHVYIDKPNEREWNKRLFDQLHERKDTIELEVDEKLKWERLDHRKASRISTVRTGSIDDEKDELKNIEDWMVDRLLTFQHVFSPILDELTNDIDST